MKIINIVVGGFKDFIFDLIGYMVEYIFWIGVDKGIVIFLDVGIIFDEVFGDFDSIIE